MCVVLLCLYIHTLFLSSLTNLLVFKSLGKKFQSYNQILKSLYDSLFKIHKKLIFYLVLLVETAVFVVDSGYCNLVVAVVVYRSDFAWVVEDQQFLLLWLLVWLWWMSPFLLLVVLGPYYEWSLLWVVGLVCSSIHCL